MQFLDLPEEILHLILLYVHGTPPSKHDTSNDIIRSKTHSSDLPRALLLNHTLNRIGTPILYDTLPILFFNGANHLARTLEGSSGKLARHVRVVQAWFISLSVSRILSALSGAQCLTRLDLRFEIRATPSEIYQHLSTRDDSSTAMLWPAARDEVRIGVLNALGPALLALAPGPQTLVLRRAPMPHTADFFDSSSRIVAHALRTWHALERVELGYTDEAQESTRDASCIAGTLACAPKLRSVRALLPDKWTPALLVIASNPALEKLEIVTLHLPRRPINSEPRDIVSTAPTAAAAIRAAPPPLKERLQMAEFHFNQPERGRLRKEQWLLTRAQISGHEGTGEEWIMEARKHPRLVEVLLAGALDAEK